MDDKQVDKIEKQLDKLEAEAQDLADGAMRLHDRDVWQAKALAYRVASAVVHNRRDPNWED